MAAASAANLSITRDEQGESWVAVKHPTISANVMPVFAAAYAAGWEVTDPEMPGNVREVSGATLYRLSSEQQPVTATLTPMSELAGSRVLKALAVVG